MSRQFEIEGPDEDGHVWICSAEGRHVWCHNLGPAEEAAEGFSQWLGQIDFQESERQPIVKPPPVQAR